ncbi:MAG: hypothetical protein RSC44_03030 [Clostridia bacterium]
MTAVSFFSKTPTEKSFDKFGAELMLPKKSAFSRYKLSLPPLKFIAYFCMTLGHLALVLQLYSFIRYATFAPDLDFLDPLIKILTALSQVTLPLLFFLACVSVISREGHHIKQLLTLCASAVMMYGIVTYFNYGPDGPVLISFISGNLFLDLLSMNLIYLFMFSYQPFADIHSERFNAKLAVAFRALSILPIAYVLGCYAVKILEGNHMLVIPFWAHGFVTNKGIQNYIFFFIFVAFARRYRVVCTKKYGVDYLKTTDFIANRNIIAVLSLVAVTLVSLIVGHFFDQSYLMFKDYSHAIYAAPLFMMFNGNCKFKTIFRKAALLMYLPLDMLFLFANMMFMVNDVFLGMTLGG